MSQLDRTDLQTGRSALTFVSRTLAARNEPTAAFDCVAARIAEVLTSSANGSPTETTRDDEWVDTTEAARLMNCSDRWARDIAHRIGIKMGGRWWIRRDAIPQQEDE